MELDELHVRHPAAGTPGHRHAVAGGDVGVGRVQIDLAGAAGREHGVARGEGHHPAGFDVEHVGAEAAFVRLADLVAEHQIDGDVMLEDVDVRVCPHLGGQRRLHRRPGGVGGVDDAPVRVAALAGQVVAQLGVGFAGEGHATVDQPFDGALAVLDDEAGGFGVAQAGAGGEGILDVGFDAVGGVEYRGDAALGPVAGAVGQFALGDEGDTQAVGEPEGHGLACRTAAEDEYVVLFQQDVARAQGKGPKI